MGKTIAITGATGNIGGALAEVLLSNGHQVRAIGRSKGRLAPFVAEGSEAWVGSLDDAEFLTRAFKGADAVFTMIPPHATVENFRAYQNQVGEALGAAIRNADVKEVLNLSSIGGQHAAGTGPIKGLHDHEERLNGLAGVNVIHLRPAFFMENLLLSIDAIRGMGVNGSPIDPKLAFPMIATRDIAAVAADLLGQGDFSGKSARELLGAGDVTMTQATGAIGKAIGREDLKYVHFSFENARQAMLGLGMSASVVDELIEMYRGLNEGIVAGTEVRSAANTTPTTIEEFAQAVFAPAYNRTASAKSQQA